MINMYGVPRFQMSDLYDWHGVGHGNLSVTLCGIKIQDEWAAALQRHENLHSFNQTANWNEDIGKVPCPSKDK